MISRANFAAKAILGVFDEAAWVCSTPSSRMNCCIPGVFKERLSQSTLYAAMQR